MKDLLQPGMHAFLPFSGTLTTQSRSNKDFAVYSSEWLVIIWLYNDCLWKLTPSLISTSSGAYKLHVLQKVLVLSKLSAPQSGESTTYRLGPWVVCWLSLLQVSRGFSPLCSCVTLDVLERLLEELWEDSSYSASSQKEQNEFVELSPFFADLLMAALSDSGNALSDFVNARKWGAADHVDLISGVILVSNEHR